MAIGLSTYAFSWRLSDAAPAPLTLAQVLERTAALGGAVLQVCDHPPLLATPRSALEDLRARAEELGTALEVGTRGVRPDHLLAHLEVATALGARLVRTLLHTADDRPAPDEAVALLRQAVPAFAERGVVLGLETYELVSTPDLVGVVEAVDSPWLGVVLDPGNCVATLEHPREVVELTADHVVGIHVKDFAFTRREGGIGYTVAGCPLGEGLLDHAATLARLRPLPEGVHQVLEHWLPWQGDAAATCRLEEEWTRRGLEVLAGLQ